MAASKQSFTRSVWLVYKRENGFKIKNNEHGIAWVIEHDRHYEWTEQNIISSLEGLDEFPEHTFREMGFQIFGDFY